MHKIVSLSVILIVLLAMTAFGQDKPMETGTTDTQSEMTTMKGIVIDQMCGEKIASKDDAMTKAAKHKRECAMSDDCSASGYGVISDGKWYKFDGMGDKKAVALLKKSHKKDNLMVEVSGKQDGTTFAVSSIKEIKAKKMKSGKSGEMKSEKSGM